VTGRPREAQAHTPLGGTVRHRQGSETRNVQAGQQSRRGLRQRLEHPTATSLLPLRCFQVVHIPRTHAKFSHQGRVGLASAKPDPPSGAKRGGTPSALKFSSVQVTLHFCPDQRAKKVGSHAGGMQPRQVDVLLRLPTRPAWRPRPTRHATGASDASCRQLHRHLCHHRASSIVEPIPRLEATQRTTQQRQPGAAVNAAKSGPTVMTVAGEREQWSRRQPSSRPIRWQQENPLSQREDNAPVIRSSNGPRTRNGCPANHSPRRINFAAGQAAFLAGAAGDASPSP
jgi:hypothetical protein